MDMLVEKTQIMDQKAMSRAITRISFEIIERNKGAGNLCIVGIVTRGAQLAQRVAQMGQAQVAQRIGVGEPTLRDMVAELSKPGRDPRDELPKPLLRTDVMEMSDLKEGMVLTGTVRNVTDFGAFVDIAVHEDGLVHISQISKRRISHPSQVLKVGDIVQVKVLEVDLERRRISLTMKDL
jgi:uncharacterized protein